jgi:hypothetical protein
MQMIDRKLGASLAGAAFLAAIAFAAPGEAFAACGSAGVSSMAKPPASGGGGIHTDASAPVGSTGGGGGGCGATATSSLSTGGALAPALAGVKSGVYTRNGYRRSGSGSGSHTAGTITTATSTARTTSTAGAAHFAGGGAHTHFLHGGKRP